MRIVARVEIERFPSLFLFLYSREKPQTAWLGLLRGGGGGEGGLLQRDSFIYSLRTVASSYA